MRKKKPKHLKCHFCDNQATHTVIMELRERQGPPLKEDNVIRVVCDIHSIDNSFDHWVPIWAFKKLCIDWQKAGYTLNKQFCTINILKFK